MCIWVSKSNMPASWIERQMTLEWNKENFNSYLFLFSTRRVAKKEFSHLAVVHNLCLPHSEEVGRSSREWGHVLDACPRFRFEHKHALDNLIYEHTYCFNRSFGSSTRVIQPHFTLRRVIGTLFIVYKVETSAILLGNLFCALKGCILQDGFGAFGWLNFRSMGASYHVTILLRFSSIRHTWYPGGNIKLKQGAVKGCW